MKKTCSARQDLNLWEQERQVGSLNSCINELHSNKLMLKDWNCKTLTMDLLNVQENKLDHKKNNPIIGKTSSKYSNTKYSWIGWGEESSRTTSWRILSTEKRESHDAIQRLTSQLQSVQEQMNSMNDSGEFPEVESNHSGRLSHVPSQPEVIPSSSSMVSRDKRLTFDTCNALGLQENVFGNQFSTFGSSENPSQGIHHGETRRGTESVPRAKGTGISFARDDEQNKGAIPMPMFARRPSTMSSPMLVEFPQNSMLDRKDSRFRNCNSTNSLLHNHSWCGRYDSKINWLPVLIFHRMLCYGSKRWRWLSHWKNWSPHNQFMEGIFQTSRCFTRRLPLLWTR